MRETFCYCWPLLSYLSTKSMFGRSHTILLSAERVLFVFLIIWICWAPELSIRPSIWRARIVGLSHKDKRKDTRLAIGVASIRLVPGLCRKIMHTDTLLHQQVHCILLRVFTHPTLGNWLHCQCRCRSSAYYPDSWANAVHRCRWFQSLCDMFPQVTVQAVVQFEQG